MIKIIISLSDHIFIIQRHGGLKEDSTNLSIEKCKMNSANEIFPVPSCDLFY